MRDIASKLTLPLIRSTEPYQFLITKIGVLIATLKQDKTSPSGLVLSWLGIRNDYRTLIEADILDIVEIDINDSDKEGNDG